MFSTSLQILAASDDNRLLELKSLRYIHALPDIVFALRCLHNALERKRQRREELVCIAADLSRIATLLSTPQI